MYELTKKKDIKSLLHYLDVIIFCIFAFVYALFRLLQRNHDRKIEPCDITKVKTRSREIMIGPIMLFWVLVLELFLDEDLAFTNQYIEQTIKEQPLFNIVLRRVDTKSMRKDFDYDND